MTETRELKDTVAELEKTKALLKRAIGIIVAEELDRDFGEQPTASVMRVRELLRDVGFRPETCSMGFVIGYGGTPTNSEAPCECLDCSGFISSAHGKCTMCNVNYADRLPSSSAYDKLREIMNTNEKKDPPIKPAVTSTYDDTRPDRDCVSTPDGGCVSTRCMHTPPEPNVGSERTS